jgi:fructose-1,6-bisphosphatase/inositol monophosphatase family enzyme/glycerophosphoryl diester phosphodiesterase
MSTTSTTTDRLIRVTAHRGDSSRFRENTLPAIRSAIEAGADFVEIDVRVSRDGQVIVLHDSTLLRLWGLDRSVDEVDFDEIRALGSGDERIPLLSEVLELFRDCTPVLLVDMEEEAPAVAASAVVAASGVTVSWCGHLEGMRTVRRLDADARIWLPWNKRSAPPAELLAELRPEFVNSEFVVLSPAIVDEIHAAGSRVACWTVDQRDDMRWVLELGVDSITTNQLEMLQAIVNDDPATWRGAGRPRRLTGAETLEAHTVANELANWAIDFTRSADRGIISTKANPGDLVTEIDVAVERHVREVIAERLPGHLVVGEEMGGESEDGVPCWYLDPVDGTTNLANYLPWTAFSLALAIDRTPLVGVVADPWRGDIFEAVAGHGARLNGETLSLPAASEQPLSLAGKVVATELAGHLAWPGMLELLDELGAEHSIMRIMGSSTMTVVGIAAGRGAASVIGSFSPIDHLAGTLIVREAGGVVLDSSGRPDAFPAEGGVLVATPGAADQVYDMWSRARAAAGGE